ncbi:SAM-dependent methyltransferase [Corynebacterium aquatimens]|uniref:SAM-dependent methyltransferase n=1 Tax=Corynebacterium aquatimens TaxID=1190508 RepID=UPI0018C940E2
MSTHAGIPPHLSAIDPNLWPSVVNLPTGTGLKMRARVAEAGFARACEKARISVGLDENADIIVDHEEMFSRIADSGWIGLAESYMAGEWRTQTSATLVRVVEKLVREGYRPKTPQTPESGSFSYGGVPPELVARYAGDGMSAFAGHFSTGVATSQRVKRRSFAPGAGKGNEPAAYFATVTDYEAPLESSDSSGAEKLDLADAQRNSVEMLLDAAGVKPGSHVLEVPTSGGAIAIGSALRRATVDCVALDPDSLGIIRERLVLAGSEDSVRISAVEAPERTLARREGLYDAVVSAEFLETVPLATRVRYLQIFDRMLVTGGRAAVQMVVGTEELRGTALTALESLRAFVWPALEYQPLADVVKATDRHTRLRVIATTHAPRHLELSLKHQRAMFESQAREAAADGFDVVYRRLWLWQFAIREALTRLGALDLVQLTFSHRNRRGLR